MTSERERRELRKWTVRRDALRSVTKRLRVDVALLKAVGVRIPAYVIEGAAKAVAAFYDVAGEHVAALRSARRRRRPRARG